MRKMSKRLLLMIALLLLFASSQVQAARPQVTLEELSSVSAGDSVTIKGTSSFQLVNIQIIRPDGSVLDLDTVQADEDGSFSYTLMIPADSQIGIYTITAGRSNTKAITDLQVTEKIPQRPPLPEGNYSGWTGMLNMLELSKKERQLEEQIKALLGDGEPAGSADALYKAEEIRKLIEKAMLTSNTLDVARFVQVSGNTAQINIAHADLSYAFQVIKETADSWHDNLLKLDANAEQSEVTATLDLGDFDADHINIDIDQGTIASAKAQGIAKLGVKAGGVTVMIPISELDEAVTLTIAKGDQSLKDQLPQDNAASEVYSFEINVSGQERTNFDHPVDVYVPVPDVTGLDAERLVLARINSDGSLSYFGGQYDEELGVLKAKLYAFSDYIVVEHDVSFADAAHLPSWAERAVAVLAAKGIVSGRDDSTFDPQAPLTHAELIKMVTDAFRLASGNDDQQGAWYDHYVAAAVDTGILAPAEGFNPNETVTRAEMAFYIAKTLQIVEHRSKVEHAEPYLAQFYDAYLASHAMKQELAFVMQRAVMTGVFPGIFGFNAEATRAQAALAIYNMLKLD